MKIVGTKAGVTILISSKIDFKESIIIRDLKKLRFIISQVNSSGRPNNFKCVPAQQLSLKIHKIKLDRTKGKMELDDKIKIRPKINDLNYPPA